MTTEAISAGVELRSVRHCYKRTVALDDISLAVPSGSTVALIGPDGVGKSTLLALVAGTKRIQQGKVYALGIDLAHREDRQRTQPRIAYMPQGLGKNLYTALTVHENIDFFARLFGQDRAEREMRIKQLLEAIGLAQFSGRFMGKLSGGMKQKLGLCCALVHDPDLMILDEPTTGVDPLSRRQFWQLLAGLREHRPDMSVIVATAYMEEAQRFDWLIAMDAGRLLTTGAPDEILRRNGASSLEDAFVALLPPEKRRGHRQLVVTPRTVVADGPAIEARDLTRRFGAFTAVDHVSFRIERGEIFGFVGSNGCGKTTTIKMLTGLLTASAGQAWLFGQPIDASDLSLRKRVGYMSQSFSLYAELTVRQNLSLHARLFHLPPARAAARIGELIHRFGLTEHGDSE